MLQTLQALESALSELQEQTDNAETFLSTLFMPGHGSSRRNHQEDQDQDWKEQKVRYTTL